MKGLIIAIIILSACCLFLIAGIVITAQQTIIRMQKYDNQKNEMYIDKIKIKIRTDYLDQIQMAFKFKNEKKIEMLFQQWTVTQEVEKEYETK